MAIASDVPQLLVDDRPLVLLGTGTSQRHAPWDDVSCLFWGKSYMIGQVPRLDVAFEMHAPPKCFDAGHLGSCVGREMPPLVMQRTWSEWPTSLVFPLDAARAAFTVPGRARPFLTSTPAYMLALALLQDHKPREIQLFGIDLAQGFEYQLQRPSFEFLLGIAHAVGIRVVVPAASELLRARFLYGYEDAERSAAVADLEEKIHHQRHQRDRALVDEQLARRRQHNSEAVLEQLADDLEKARL